MIKVFVMCSGVGHIGRGYESFSRELFDELKSESKLDFTLLKGAGSSSENEYSVFCLKRTHVLTRWIGKIINQSSYHVEQLTFLLFAFPILLLKKPKVIIYSDFFLGVLLWYIRKYMRLKYKLLFSNGAPNGPPFSRCDYVQQLLPFYKEHAIEAGEDPSKHIVLPYAIEAAQNYVQPKIKTDAKAKIGLSENTVILTVAAINDSHKRISYLIDEVFNMHDESVYLVVLGQKNEESNAIINKGKELLQHRFFAGTVEKENLDVYYKAADIFVLPSLTEGLPRVMLEALSYGLPVASHDYPVGRNVLKEYGFYSDFSQSGTLTELLQTILADKGNFSQENSKLRNQYVFDRFSWASLKPQYLNMLVEVSKS